MCQVNTHTRPTQSWQGATASVSGHENRAFVFRLGIFFLRLGPEHDVQVEERAQESLPIFTNLADRGPDRQELLPFTWGHIIQGPLGGGNSWQCVRVPRPRPRPCSLPAFASCKAFCGHGARWRLLAVGLHGHVGSRGRDVLLPAVRRCAAAAARGGE